MVCPKCGVENANDVQFCKQCGQPFAMANPAVVYASKINYQNQIGNYAAAAGFARTSRIFSLVATCIFGVLIVFGVLASLFAFSWLSFVF